eukprot:TRINITY_DN574_c0_g1_i3.p1 TRINITY_DN574_c0_g1~~TRINITY_DN574_c0_g1_i3.p1  ORF type:complete len:1442 (-),score=325.96 TRINITY_DN574_c0_g1_i3:202-4527(-)
MARLTALGVLLVSSGNAGFTPFADIEELKPARLEPYCDKAVEVDGHRWCMRTIRKTLDDGGDVEMSWKMHVRPDHILSLDTEAEHGVRVTRCGPGELELEVPASHEKHLEAGKFIVGSRFVHGCKHLTDKHMYHKVLQVRSKHVPIERGHLPMSRFQLATETLPHFAHMARHISFNFSYMPVEARDFRKFPEVRTNYGQHHRDKRKLASLEELGAAFAQGFGGAATPSNTAGFTSGSTVTSGASGAFANPTLSSLNPKQVSNFGWNWNFSLNETETPTFVIDKPGTKGSFIIRNPYVKAHSGCFLNFTSNYNGFMKPPHIQWQAGMKGHGIFQGRLESAMNSTHSAELDPEEYKLPGQDQIPFLRLLAQYDQPKWFSPIQKSVGNMPMSMEPGFQFQSNLYHKGPFSGYLAFGGSTHGTFNPMLHFDSEYGFWQTYNGEMLDTDLWPPNWMVFTEAFEMGLKHEPVMLLKGDFMGFNDAQAAIRMQAYNNVTVSRAGSMNFSADAQKELVVYPVRVMGITTVDLNTKYAVQVNALGSQAMSSQATNWGEVEYHDKSSTLSLGTFTDTEVANEQITVTLYQISSGVNTTMGQGTFSCTSFEQGICSPNPSYVPIMDSAGTQVALVMLFIVHSENPVNFYAAQVKGVGMSFPTLDINKGFLTDAYPSISQTDPLMLHLKQGNRTYLASLNGSLSVSPHFTGSTFIELYPAFIDCWAACTGYTMCNAPSVELWSGSTMLASAPIPEFGSSLPSGGGSNFLASAFGVATTTIAPMTKEVNSSLPPVTLVTPDGSKTIGILTLQARLTNPTQSSMFMAPAFDTMIPMGTTENFMWIVADTSPASSYTFKMIAMKLESAANLAGTDTAQYRKIGDMFMVPTSSTPQTVVTTCAQKTLPGGVQACIFMEQLSFNPPAFEAGYQMIVLIAWEIEGMTHKIYSPPFELVESTGGRRLEIETPGGSLPRLLQEAAANAQVSSATAQAAAALGIPAAPAPAVAAPAVPAPAVPAPVPAVPAPAVPAPAVPAPAVPTAAVPAAPVAAPASALPSEAAAPSPPSDFKTLMGAIFPGSTTGPPGQGSQFQMVQNIDDNDPNCKKKDLQFNFGQGLQMRGELDSMGVPQTLVDQGLAPQPGGSNGNAPMYTTPWRSLGGAQPGQTGSDLMPKELCEAGMCSSMLPGCRQAQFEKRHFPKLVFNFSRPYKYSNDTGDLVKNGMAWAFSATPEAVQVMLKEAEAKKQELLAGPQAGSPAASPTNSFSSLVAGLTRQQTPSPAPAPAPGPPPTLPGKFGSWWNQQRRLVEASDAKTAVDQDGLPVRMPTSLESHQARVEFKDGLPYIVDHNLLSLMTRHHYFMDVDDGHSKQLGKLKIIGFYLEDGGTITIPKGEAAAAEPETQKVLDASVGRIQGGGPFAVVAAGLAVAALAFSVLLRTKHASGYQRQGQVEVESGIE